MIDTTMPVVSLQPTSYDRFLVLRFTLSATSIGVDSNFVVSAGGTMGASNRPGSFGMTWFAMEGLCTNPIWSVPMGQAVSAVVSLSSGRISGAEGCCTVGTCFSNGTGLTLVGVDDRLNTVGTEVGHSALMSPGISDVACDVGFTVVELRDLFDLGDAVYDL